MLVLSRRIREKIVFPTINTVVQIVSMKSGTVRLGIEAPPDVPILREEILDRQDAVVEPSRPQEANLQQLMHQLNNRLNSGTIGLALLRRQLEVGLTADTLATLARIEQEFAGLREAIEVAERPPPRSRRRALLVEDDRNECELLAGFLRLAGLEVTTANDGADALDYLRRNDRPDVVLLDMFLPRTDGPTTVRAIRNDPVHAGLKIFGITGADPGRFNLPQGANGIDRWFHKPFNPQALLDVMTRELEG